MQLTSIGILGHIGRTGSGQMAIKDDRADADRFVGCGRDQSSSCSYVDLLAQDFAKSNS